MPLAELFGANLRHIRKAKGLTQSVLAERIEVSSDMISKMERGAAAPSFDTIERLCAVLEVQPTSFFGIGLAPGPMGARGILVQRIHATLSKASEDQLARASKIVQALVD
ncbi:helix-turn-helix domain-containing protein [Salinarimonas chemoclinalis]|uniref:helix-turn-helix domain-containing protein n=1 Tax=Salinarimonas chemoclinalis TaxID=3241599 RepID=UPI0035586D9D